MKTEKEAHEEVSLVEVTTKVGQDMQKAKKTLKIFIGTQKCAAEMQNKTKTI